MHVVFKKASFKARLSIGSALVPLGVVNACPTQFDEARGVTRIFRPMDRLLLCRKKTGNVFIDGSSEVLIT